MKKKEFTRKILEYNRELFDLLESISGKVAPEEFLGKAIAFREEVKIGDDTYKFHLQVKDYGKPIYKPELSIYRDNGVCYEWVYFLEFDIHDKKWKYALFSYMILTDQLASELIRELMKFLDDCYKMLVFKML